MNFTLFCILPTDFVYKFYFILYFAHGFCLQILLYFVFCPQILFINFTLFCILPKGFVYKFYFIYILPTDFVYKFYFILYFAHRFCL